MMGLVWITVMLFNEIDSEQIIDIHQPNPTITADVGDNVTLRCFRLRVQYSGAIVWYKQKIGHEPSLMLTDEQLSDKFTSPRFGIEKNKNSSHLKIANVQLSDEAMYYCGFVIFTITYGKGTFLSVKGKPDLSVSVSQSSVLDSVPAGASVTLQCSVLSESRAAELQVLWFRAAPPQSHPQIIYTHHNSSHQCDSTHTCVYNFSKNILSLNDTGTYYCAVAACGKIVFGNGTRVQLEGPVDSVVMCLAVALGVCVVIIFALTFVITCKKRNNVKRKQGSITNKSLNQNCNNEELNYSALHFNKNKGKGRRVKKHQPQDTVYSDVQYTCVT
ncbi:uncharacterized protein LOC128531347 [Clarias gariepinus]|uniref:uncharacterized protein LOC128531347 n=1 Tax=Clarias gariepinus TaxID=13013 RepID=UPI00234C3FE9|nr:uncharacterized protein LOC128531347 [Clarias gariepinus]